MAKPRRSFAKKETLYEDTATGKVAVGARFKFSDGQRIDVKCIEFPAAIRAEAEAHGLKQKLGDSYNKAETVAEARETLRAYRDRLMGGDWNAERTGFGIADEFIIKAIARMKNKTVDEIQVTWDNLSAERLNAIRSDEAVKAEAEKIRAEEKAEKAGEADELGEF